MIIWAHLLLAFAQLTIAWKLWHHTAIAIVHERRGKAWKIYGLGVALALFGYGQFEAALGLATIAPIRMVADVVLVSYGVLRLRHIVSHVPPPHWSETL